MGLIRMASRTLPLLISLVTAAGALAGAEAGIADLGQGISAYNSRDFNAAIAHLRTAQSVTKLADYDSYYLGYSQLLTGNVDGALAALNAYRTHPIDASPLAGKISVLYGRALIDKRDKDSIAKALTVLQ